jgi:hypothetical protein
MEKFITPEDKELFPWLHCSPIIKTIEQQITASTKIKFAIEAIKRKLLAITTATNDGVYDDEVKYIERKILIMLKANDKLQAKEKDLITKQNETKTELDNTLETLIAKRHPNYHHPKGTWNDADKRAYARFTSAYEAILTANYDHRQLMHKKKKELKKQAIEKKKDEDNALLQLTRKDLNQTIASSMKAYIKKLKVNNQAVKTKNVQRPAANAGQKKTNKPKTVAKGKGNGKQTSRKNKRNGGGATRN